MSKVKVIGCGSLLMGDDAVGCIIARELFKEEFPENVKVFEAGTPGLNLLSLFDSGDRVIIVDAVVTGEKEPGTLTIYDESEIPQPEQMPLSAHHIAIPETIKMGRQVQPELMPDSIKIWGIEIKVPVEEKFDMSDRMKSIVPGIVEKLKKEVLEMSAAMAK